MCTTSVFVFRIASGFCCLSTKARLLQKIEVSDFFVSSEVVHKTVCTIFVQLVFPRKKRAQKHALFEKKHFALQK